MAAVFLDDSGYDWLHFGTVWKQCLYYTLFTLSYVYMSTGGCEYFNA